jgi:hypothetical protein
MVMEPKVTRMIPNVKRDLLVMLSNPKSKSTTGGVPCSRLRIWKKIGFKETMSKRRKGYPSETHVKRGFRKVHGEKELHEKLGRRDPCPCGSGRRFQELLLKGRENGWK